MPKYTEPKHPRTNEEWQDAVDGARVALLLDGMIQFGMVTGPDCRVKRAEWLLHVGEQKGFYPIEGNVVGMLREILAAPAGEKESKGDRL